MLLNYIFLKSRDIVKKCRAFFHRSAFLTGLIAVVPARCFAAGVSLASITKNIDVAVSSLARIFVDIALVAGVGFIMAAFFKFHQHKQNPQQVPISNGITLLLVGAGLTMFTVILPTATSAVFGSASMAQVGGGQLSSLIGAVSATS